MPDYRDELEAEEMADDDRTGGHEPGKGRDEWRPPSDGSWVPKARLDTALGQLRETRGSLEQVQQRLERLEQKSASNGEGQEYTRAQLLAAVEEGQVSQAQADEIWERQIERRVERKMGEEIERRSVQSQRSTLVTSELNRYKSAVPELLEDGSDVRQRVESEYTFLLSTGLNPGLETELAAVRAVLGPADRLKANPGARRQETHQETGYGSDSGTGGKDRSFKDRLSPSYRAYYDDQIRKGRYKNWKAVEDELKHADPHKRERIFAG